MLGLGEVGAATALESEEISIKDGYLKAIKVGRLVWQHDMIAVEQENDTEGWMMWLLKGYVLQTR